MKTPQVYLVKLLKHVSCDPFIFIFCIFFSGSWPREHLHCEDSAAWEDRGAALSAGAQVMTVIVIVIKVMIMIMSGAGSWTPPSLPPTAGLCRSWVCPRRTSSTSSLLRYLLCSLMGRKSRFLIQHLSFLHPSECSVMALRRLNLLQWSADPGGPEPEGEGDRRGPRQQGVQPPLSRISHCRTGEK